MKFTDLRFVPLGGVGEIGVNCYLYGQDGRWAMVDLGLGFPDDRLPGVDIVLPDLRFIEEQRAFLDGLILTHAHEDHLGAVPYLWPRLGCPIWCTPFTAAVLRAKLSETDFSRDVPIRIVEPGQPFKVGGLDCRFVHVTHSIPDANALVLDTTFGRVLHTGDWKLDPAPLVGARTDVDALELVGKDGVLAMLCDSTNVLSPGTSGSEAEVRDSLTALIGAQRHRVVLTSFSSNIARLETAMFAARAAGRELFVVGRSMRRMIDAAREVGYLKDIPPIRDEREADLLPRHKVLYLCTGSQGEARSALTRVAAGQHPRVTARARRHRHLQRQDHPRQRADALQPAQPAGPGRDRGDHRGRPFRPCLRPSLPRRARADVSLDTAQDRRARAWRGATSARPPAAGAADGCAARSADRERRHGPAGTRNAGRDRRGGRRAAGLGD